MGHSLLVARWWAIPNAGQARHPSTAPAAKDLSDKCRAVAFRALAVVIQYGERVVQSVQFDARQTVGRRGSWLLSVQGLDRLDAAGNQGHRHEQHGDDDEGQRVRRADAINELRYHTAVGSKRTQGDAEQASAAGGIYPLSFADLAGISDEGSEYQARQAVPVDGTKTHRGSAAGEQNHYLPVHSRR